MENKPIYCRYRIGYYNRNQVVAVGESIVVQGGDRRSYVDRIKTGTVVETVVWDTRQCRAERDLFQFWQIDKSIDGQVLHSVSDVDASQIAGTVKRMVSCCVNVTGIAAEITVVGSIIIMKM